MRKSWLGKATTLIGNDPNKWAHGVINYAKVKYEDVYSGIDQVERHVEPEFSQYGSAGGRFTSGKYDGDCHYEIGIGCTRMSHVVQVQALPQRVFWTSRWKVQISKAVILCVLLAWLYLPIVFRLAEQCWNDPNFSHGFLVPIFSSFLLWRERSRLFHRTLDPSPWGLPLLILALGVLAAGVLGADLFLSRFSLLLVVASLVIYLLGWEWFRSLLFPGAFLILMIPPPEILWSQITFPLQILASKLAAALLPLMGIPIFRQGNRILLPAMPLEVSEACSGIRSLLSLLTLAIIYGYLFDNRKWVRIVLALAALPFSVIANSLRVVGTGLLAQYCDPTWAQGFYHGFSGLFIFLSSLALISCLHLILRTRRRGQERYQHAL